MYAYEGFQDEKRSLLSERDAWFSDYRSCQLCPRLCGAARLQGEAGVCGATEQLYVARAALHFWEEPPISGNRGSGTIFFSNCPMKCIFCQNHEISSAGFGKQATLQRLRDIMFELQDQGAHNINAVTATHYLPHLVWAYHNARHLGLTLPLVYNSSGFELVESLKKLEGSVAIWLPDFKYAQNDLAQKLSRAPRYTEYALAAITEMLRQLQDAGGPLFTDEGIAQRACIVRHLVLPGHLDNSYEALRLLWENFGNTIELSLMNQFTVTSYLGQRALELLNPLTDEEYHDLIDYAYELGFIDVYWQEGGAVSESFIPQFDTTGV